MCHLEVISLSLDSHLTFTLWFPLDLTLKCLNTSEEVVLSVLLEENVTSFNNGQRRRGAGWGVGATPAERKGGITRGIPEQALPKHTSPVQGVFQVCLNDGQAFLFNHLYAIVLSARCAKSSGTRTIY